MLKRLLLTLIFSGSLLSGLAQSPTLDSYLARIEQAQAEQNLPEMLEAYEGLLSDYEALGGDPLLKPRYLFERALYLSYSGQYDQAIAIIMEVIELTERDKSQIETRARCFMQLGLIYFFQEHWDRALEHYLKAEELALESGSLLGQSIAKNNIGNVYQKKFQYAEAIDYYNESLALQESVQDSATICNTIYNIGSCYEELGVPEVAVRNFEEARQIAARIGDREIEALSMIHEGVLKESAKLIEQSIDIVKQTGHRQVLVDAYHTYARLKAESGDFRAAYYNVIEAEVLSDSLLRAESIEQLNDFTVRYKAAEHEAEAAIYRVRLNAAIIIFVVILLLGYLVYRVQRKSNRRLREVNVLKDKFMRVVSHDIKNPLISQRTVLELMVNNMEYLQSDDIKTQCHDLLRSSGSLLDLLYNLLSWSQIESKTIRYVPTRVDLHTICQEVQEMFFITLHKKQLQLIIDVAPNTLAFGDYNMISTILRNLVNNALKYSHPESVVRLSAEPAGCNKWRVSVQDFGVGMDRETQHSLFKLASARSRAGTAGESGTGIGLLIVREMVAMNGGAVEVESAVGKGTTISFTVKKSDETH